MAKRNKRSGFISFFGRELALIVGLLTAVVFVAAGGEWLTNISHPGTLALVFAWLFLIVLWSAISVVRHADCLAIKCGEPYGTLILTLSAITIEVMMISAAMLHGKNNPTLARDMMFAVIMIALNGLIGLSLLFGGLRYRAQVYNLEGTSAYLNTIMALTVLGLILPNYTISLAGPRFSSVQEIFLAATSIVLYVVFLLLQTKRHSQYFMEAEGVTAAHDSAHHPRDMRSAPYHTIMLVVYLLVVIVLAEKFAIPLDNLIEEFRMPQALGGAIVAALVLAPEALAGINAARKNQLQRSVNILHGSVLASIGLTIPAVLTIGMTSGRSVLLGIEGGNLPLLVLTFGVSIVTFMGSKTSVLQGCIHLLLFCVFILLIFCP